MAWTCLGRDSLLAGGAPVAGGEGLVAEDLHGAAPDAQRVAHAVVEPAVLALGAETNHVQAGHLSYRLHVYIQL